MDLGLFVGEVVKGEGDVESAGGEERPAAFAVSIKVLGHSWLHARLCGGAVCAIKVGGVINCWGAVRLGSSKLLNLSNRRANIS